MLYLASRQTDYVRAQYASPFRVLNRDRGTSGLSDFADKVLRDETGRGLYQHGHGSHWQNGRYMIHAAGYRFQAIPNS